MVVTGTRTMELMRKTVDGSKDHTQKIIELPNSKNFPNLRAK